MSTTGVITATGTKGLLQYLKTYQPALYQKANPVLIAYAKKQNGLGCMRTAALGRLARIGRLGDVSDDGSGELIDDSSGLNVDSLTDFDAGPVIVTTPPDLVITNTSGASDSAAVASAGPTSSGFASIISSIANGFSTATLTAAQVSANNTLLQTNLARAQQGLPPLTATTAASGATLLGSSSNLLLLGGAALIALLVLGNKKAA